MSKVSSKNKINKPIKTEEEEKEKIQVKILIIGETGVGKSNFIYRYIELMEWNKIAILVHMSERTVFRKHREILNMAVHVS